MLKNSNTKNLGIFYVGNGDLMAANSTYDFVHYMNLLSFTIISNHCPSSLLSPYYSSYYSSSFIPPAPNNFPINSSLCFSFSFSTVFCFKIFYFSFIMFYSKFFIVSINSCIFPNSSSNLALFSSASVIYFSFSSTSSLTSSNLH